MSVFQDVFAVSFEAQGVVQVIQQMQRYEGVTDSLSQSFARLHQVQASGTAAQVANAHKGVEALLKQKANMDAISAVTGAGIAGAGALSFLREEINLAKQAIDVYAGYAKQVQTVHQLTGAGLGASQSFVNLSQVAGVSDAAQIKEVLALTKDLNSQKGKNALAQLGVSGGGNELQTFQQVIGALGKMQDGVRKTNLEIQLFGQRGVQAIQLFLNLQSDIIEKTALFSANLDGGAIASIQHLQQNVGVLGLAFQNDIVIPIAQKIVPALEWAVNGVESVILAFKKMDDATYGLASMSAAILGVGLGLAAAVAAAMKFGKAIEALIAIEEVQNVVAAIGDALTGNWKNLAAAAVVGGAAYVGFHYLNDKNGIGNGDNPADKIDGAADKFSNAADNIKAAADNFKSWAQAGGSEVPGGITNADYSTFKRLDAWGAVG